MHNFVYKNKIFQIFISIFNYLHYSKTVRMISLVLYISPLFIHSFIVDSENVCQWLLTHEIKSSGGFIPINEPLLLLGVGVHANLCMLETDSPRRDSNFGFNLYAQ